MFNIQEKITVRFHTQYALCTRIHVRVYIHTGQFLRLLYFQKSYMNIKLKFQVGSGPLISTVRQGPCGLNPVLLGGIPQVSNPPSTSPLPCSEDHHLPLSDCEFSLIY